MATSLLLALPADAARPLQTDDAGTLARGDCELEAVTLRQRAANEKADESSVQFGCGVGANSQLALALATARSGGARETGLAVGGKTALGPLFSGTDLAVSWQIVGARYPAESWHHVGTGVNLLASRPLSEQHTLHLNLGHSRDEQAKRGSTTWGVGIEHGGLGLAPSLAPMAELFGDDRERPWWNLGLRLTATPDKLFFDLSYGRQFASGQPSLLTLGLKAAF